MYEPKYPERHVMLLALIHTPVLSNRVLYIFRCLVPTPSSRSSEFGFPWNILNLLKLGTHLDYRVSNQTGIERHGLSQGMLCACARIEAHDEVMAIVVGRLQFLRRLWKEKGAPVGDTANDAVLLKNDPASGFGDSGRRISVRSPGYAHTIMRWW